MIADRYRLDRLLGVGGMGAVYDAENLALGRRVALKLLHPKLAKEEDTVERFKREARGVSQLNHPGFAQVFTLDTTPDGVMFIEMELLHGTGVDQLVKQGPILIERCIAIMDSALDALAVAHEAGLVHRDLKPENLFLCRDPRRERGGSADAMTQVKILDFGIARTMETNEQRLTTTGEFMGTVLYASPEQLTDTAATDARSDMFSFGATAYEIVVGTSPAAAGSYAEVISRIMMGEHDRRPSKRRADVPGWLDDLIARALEMDPAKRFLHAGEMLQLLRAAPASAPSATSSSHAIAFVPHVPPPSIPPGNVAVPALAAAVEVPSSQRARWLKLGGAVGLVIAVVVLVAITQGGTQAPAASVANVKGNMESPATPAYPATEAGARKIVEALRTDRKLLQTLRPAAADFTAVFEGTAAATAEAFYTRMWEQPDHAVTVHDGQTDVKLFHATTEELRQWTPRATEFPNGYRRIATSLKPGLVFYRWTYVKPGETLGMAYDGLVHVNGRWVWFPKPFRALPSTAR